MLTFRHPGSLGSCLTQTYEYLRPSLENLMGHPVTLRTFSPGTVPTGQSVRAPDGALSIRLPGPAREPGRTFLCLSDLASQDELCRQVAASFVRMCNRIARQAKKSWDLKAQLIREEQFLWDNMVLSQFYRGNQKYNVLDLLGTAREAVAFRYEGSPVRLGLIATWNWHQLQPLLIEQNCTILEFSAPFDLRRRLKEDKASHLLTDGSRGFYVVNTTGAAIAWASIAPGVPADLSDTWEVVPREYHHIDAVLIGRDMAISVNRHGEILLFCRHSAVKWNRDGWRRLVGPSLSALLSDYVPATVAPH